MFMGYKVGGIGNAAKNEVMVKSGIRGYIDMTDDDYQYTIESGDYIWVPKENPRAFDFYLIRIAPYIRCCSGCCNGLLGI